MEGIVHAVLIPKALVKNSAGASRIVRRMGFSPIKPVHPTAGYYRYRISPPIKKARYVTRRLPNGILVILTYTS